MSEDEKYYEAARDLFMSDGWRDFIAEVKGLEGICNLDACNSSDEFWFNKGKLAACRVILGYEDMVMAAESQED